MARMNIYLPDELHRLVKRRNINVSQICQDALVEALQLSAVKTNPEPWTELTRDEVNWIKQAASAQSCDGSNT